MRPKSEFSRGFYITLGSWIGDTAHLAARLQLENGGLIALLFKMWNPSDTMTPPLRVHPPISP